ncbi:phosphate ABC transporter, permease protein PstA [Photobacterium jeanii]|uniref:Phosphate transport system permease protein PstA n=1 Tax=Photobacterium jeanii TaxID=858640 RepID=A0A178KA82_9GAMM|nr:phosphate ABC transporter permease PstA [Photobacterium jeanii]OAN14259.1 phosphate ABC transporter, permease protein PstA [Photobacterium jeanii]PST89780.1 phosphate ABC transporter permease PtsA [Photobacterium jeanii]
MGKWIKSGSPWIWLTAGAVSLSLIAVLGLLLLIGWKGLSYFWPAPVYQFDIEQNGQSQVVIGEVYERQMIPLTQLAEAGVDVSMMAGPKEPRYLIKIGNRERVGLDFMTILGSQIKQKQLADGIAVIDREQNGKFYGYPVSYIDDDQRYPVSELHAGLEQAQVVRDEMARIKQEDFSAINWQLEELRVEERRKTLAQSLTPAEQAEFAAKREALNQQYLALEKHLFALQSRLERDAFVVRDMTGEEVRLPIEQVLDVWYPNNLTTTEKVMHWLKQVGKFLRDDPREANTEGGVFPAIFGTVFMVMLMSVIVTPLGVLAAIYLHEYAGRNRFTKLIRVAVINLAGVPSIVYGVFGLGFFVYMVGGTVDDLFFSAQLPAPTFGTPGILWSALTLAILTLPVVIVSTEEGLARVPSSVRHGSLALGATQAETLWRIVLPMASPAIMTGLILAVARAAGEVAPLMLVGVVKMAPTLPIDGNFPYIHLDRKFMHLGYHIYDVGFQSPNVEAARPLVYATSFLLVTVIIGLNLTAIGIRNHLREKFRSLEQ